jgi:branched-chain amino acid transport system permease protein
MRTTVPMPEATGLGQSFTVSVAKRSNYAIGGFGIAVLIVLAIFPLFGVTEWTRRLIDLLCFLAMAQLWNLMLGYAGLISAGQQGFIGIGAYTLWFFSDILHISPFAAVILAAIAGIIIAFPAAFLVFRLKGGYLAIGTWVIAEVIRLIMTNVKRAGGGSGIDVTSAGALVSKLGTDAWYSRVYWWALAAALLAIAVTYLLLRSRTGLGLKAMRDNDLAAESNGVNLWRTKLFTWVIAGAGFALVGAIRAMYDLRVNPGSNFSINWTAYLIFICVIGGIGTIEGPIIGTIIFYILRETTSKYGTWYFIILGLVAIAVTIWSPQGIYGWVVKKTGYMVFPLQRQLRLYGDDVGGGPISGKRRMAGRRRAAGGEMKPGAKAKTADTPPVATAADGG